MKRTVILLTALLLLIAASQALSQISRKSQFEIFGGAAFPLSPDVFKDYYKLGYSIHGQYVIFPSPRLGIAFGAAYEPFTFDGDAFLEDLEEAWGAPLEGYEIEGTAKIIEVCAGLRPYLTSSMSSTQIFLFGMATYNFLMEEATIKYTDPFWGYTEDTETAEDDEFGLAAGAGIEIPAGDRLNIIVQGITRFIFTEDETTSFVGVTAGIVF